VRLPAAENPVMQPAMNRERINPPPTSTERAQEAAAVWFARLRRRHVSKNDRVEFESWLAADESHRREFSALERIWNESGDLARRRRSGSRTARALVPLVAIAVLGAWYVPDWLAGRTVTGAGDRRHEQLADGSRLDIAPRTRVRVEFDGAQRRLVLEEGRIAVTVAPDPQRPFQVVTAEGSIRDIGTRFEVETGVGRVRVTVAEGAVEIDPAAAATARRVSSGQRAEYDQGNVTPPQPVDVNEALAWTRGQLMFDAVPLGEVITVLNRFRSTPIEIDDPELGSIRISGVFLLDDEAATLRALEQVVSVAFERTWGRITAVRRKG
jgi:transmembrane sensor